MQVWMVLALGGCNRSVTLVTPPPPSGVLLTEVMAGNDAFLTDPDSPECPEYDDWIEIANRSDAPVEITGWVLSDTSGSFTFPEQTLAAGEHLMVWADDQPEQGELHAPFKVSASGERLELRVGARLVDAVVVQPVARDHTWSRGADGSWSERASPTPGEPDERVLPEDPCLAAQVGFDDHTTACLGTAEAFHALAGSRSGLEVVKFDIFDFQDPGRRSIAYMDSRFYTLHDQLYLFHVFNGQMLPNLDLYPPVEGLNFATWGELERWARSVDLGAHAPAGQARFADDRLYSPYYYAAVNGENRAVGVGTLVHRPETDQEAPFWGFELEHADAIEHADLVVYFETLAETGPPELAEVQWLVRSPEQEELARRMEEEGLAYADRVVRYAELTRPGTVEVYNPGLTAGRVLRVGPGHASLDEARPTDLLLLDTVPDALPPCAGLITDVPQTPLSHVALLARSRGIPNLHVNGISTDPRWDAWARIQTRVALEALPDGTYRANALSTSDYLLWRSLATRSAPDLDPVEPSTLPYAIDLATSGSPTSLRPVVGGKAAGMRLLLTVPEVDPPDVPLALTVRGYHEHLEQFDWIAEVLEGPPFTDPNRYRERFLVLEGRARFDATHPTLDDAAVADGFLLAHPAGDRVGDVARSGGIRGAVARQPMLAGVEVSLLEAVQAAAAGLPVGQGLRFRSSSTVEDAEGFNGAGLYVSRTGFLDPLDGERSVSEAIREVWASYWAAEAYEEREAARFRHLDGGMGVLVHPRFDDAFELSNSVFTLTRLPDGSVEMLVNAQDGAISVATPPTTCPPVLPETVKVVRDAEGVRIERLGTSTEVDGEVLSDEQILSLLDQGSAITDAWLAEENTDLEASRLRGVLTLDLEAREMASGWAGSTNERLVVKQARSLEPSLARLPEVLRELPVPREILARAGRIERTTCHAPAFSATAHQVWTNPLLLPDLGFAEAPFFAGLDVSVWTDLPELGLFAGDSVVATHLDVETVTVDAASMEVAFVNGRYASTEGTSMLELDGGVAASDPTTCVGETVWASPDSFLRSLL